MHDDDKAVLEKWRALRGNKFLTLTTAKELEKTERQFQHLAKQK